jgi:hypothetical protein
MGFLDRLFGRRRRESVDTWARRDDSSFQYVQQPVTDQSGGQGEAHHAHEGTGQQDPGAPPQDSQPQQDAPAGWDVQGDLEAAGGDSAGGSDAGGGGDSGGGGDGGGGDGGGGGGGD